jgi:uncharacterized protein YmfQ (DUF2313 family)
MVKRFFPPGIWTDDSEVRKDHDALGVVLSWARKSLEWIGERIWPWLDDDDLFLPDWERSFGLTGSGTVDERQDRVMVKARSFGTLTLARLQAIMGPKMGIDPADVAVHSPSGSTVDGYSPDTTWQYNENAFNLHVYDTNGTASFDHTEAWDIIKSLQGSGDDWTVGKHKEFSYDTEGRGWDQGCWTA